MGKVIFKAEWGTPQGRREAAFTLRLIPEITPAAASSPAAFLKLLKLTKVSDRDLINILAFPEASCKCRYPFMFATEREREEKELN